MSKIDYVAEASDAIRTAGKTAAELHYSPTDRMAHEIGHLRYAFESLARRAELDSQFAQIRERIASSMMFDLREASELIDAIRAGIERQHPDTPDVSVLLQDAAQALYDAADQDADEPDQYRSAA